MDVSISQKVRRAGELATGFATWKITDYAFDYLLYPFAIFRLGPLVGAIVMALLSLAFCLLLLRLYDHFQRDWLGLEFVKSLKVYDGGSTWRRVMGWLLRRGNVVAFLLLSVRYDSFITTAYLRPGAFCGLSKRDWAIFLGSWFIGNVTWTVVCLGGLSVLQLV